MNEIKLPEQSAKFTFNKQDALKILKGAGIAGLGAAATYLATEIKGIDFGQWTPFVAMGAAVLANIIRKWMAGK